jgi:hypothetical protein
VSSCDVNNMMLIVLHVLAYDCVILLTSYEVYVEIKSALYFKITSYDVNSMSLIILHVSTYYYII